MTAAMYEPADPPVMPIVPVTPEAFDAIAVARGAVIEVGSGGRIVAVQLRGIEYVTEATS